MVTESAATQGPPAEFRNRPPSPARGPLRLPDSGFGRNFYENGLNARAEPFRGVRTSAGVPADMYPLAATGLSLAPLVAAARRFLESLSFEQYSNCLFGVESDWFRTWHNLHSFFFRHGVCLADLPPEQRDLALDIVRQSLSQHGFDSARDVMKLNEHMGELRGRLDDYGEWFYWISFFGHPSRTEPWGWQVDGHHLIINCLVIGDQIVTTPAFMGSEPIVAQSGAYAGTRVFEREERLGWEVMNSLTPAQQAVARIGDELPFDVFAGAFADNAVMEEEGIAVRAMDAAQREKVARLVSVYLERERDGHREIRMREVLSALDEGYFAWIGRCDDTSPFYYRFYSPLMLIEFDHQPGVVYANNEHSRRHAHTLVRTPNGNDYGKAWLRQYYDQVERRPLTGEGAVERDTRVIRPLGSAIEDLSRGDR